MQTAKKLSGIVTIHINTAQSASNQRLSIAMRSAADRGWMGGSSLCGGIAAGTRRLASIALKGGFVFSIVNSPFPISHS
jgi:hypothetical protein